MIQAHRDLQDQKDLGVSVEFRAKRESLEQMDLKALKGTLEQVMGKGMKANLVNILDGLIMRINQKSKYILVQIEEMMVG